jgi:hypothetical protein
MFVLCLLRGSAAETEWRIGRHFLSSIGTFFALRQTGAFIAACCQQFPTAAWRLDMWNLARALSVAFLTAIAGPTIDPLAVGRGTAIAQERQHPAHDMALHEKFYSTWYMPDEPNKSCCNKADCYPTLVKYQDGQWWAMRREDHKYIPVPWKKVEINRNNPDGRNHLCAPPPSSAHAPNTVFCFALGGGI